MVTQNRRTFLQRTGIAAVGAGLAGCSHLGSKSHSTANGAGTASAILPVQLDRTEDPLCARIFMIMQDRIQQRCATHVVKSDQNAKIILHIDIQLPIEAFRIDDQGNAVRISGGSARGVMYGVGKFLRTSTYDGAFVPSAWRGVSAPNGTLRGIYFASHFHNWYHQASEPELSRYMEDLALWGVNALMVIFPMINLQGWDDPQAEPSMNMVRQYAKTARNLGIQFVTGVNNALFIGAPKNIRAARLPDPTGRRGNSGHPICPSHPEGHAYIMENTHTLFEKLSDVGLDAIMFWPYDEGGCACEKCRPWGSNGYYKLSRDMARLGRSIFPNLKTIMSTWMFDTPMEGEWQGLREALAKDEKWLDYILADSHEDFPRYPLDVGVPGQLPLINFPEISMWGNWPWGGVGAHPLPARFQRLWDQVKHLVKGGFPYSEGIYEDMNKAMVAQFYWDKDRSGRETLAEYIDYEFGSGHTEPVLTLVDILENSTVSAFRKQPVDKVAVQRGMELAETLQTRVPDWVRHNWRWEILYLRAILDHERFVGEGLTSPVAEKAMLRLVELYHCQLETDDPYHHRVRPPLRRAVNRNGKL